MSTLRDICSIFCCPPFPSSIASKLAFLPPEASYFIEEEEAEGNQGLRLTDTAEWQYSESEKANMEAFYTTTRRGNRIGCLYVKCSRSPKYTILYSHGNAVDIGHMSSFYFGLGNWVNCNILSYDYSGYGVSEGIPSEKNLYSDIDAAWSVLITRYNLKPQNIILYGQSIGTVPTIDLATRQQVAAVILHSAIMSGIRVICPRTTRTYFFDAFANIEKVHRIASPTLVIHGKEDNVVDISHGIRIYEKCPQAVEPLWVEGVGHDGIDCRCGPYLERMRMFIGVELNEIRNVLGSSSSRS